MAAATAAAHGNGQLKPRRPFAHYSLWPPPHPVDIENARLDPLRQTDNKLSPTLLQPQRSTRALKTMSAPAPSIPWNSARRNPHSIAHDSLLNPYAILPPSDHHPHAQPMRSVSKSSQRSYDLGGTRPSTGHGSGRSEYSVDLRPDVPNEVDDAALPRNARPPIRSAASNASLQYTGGGRARDRSPNSRSWRSDDESFDDDDFDDENRRLSADDTVPTSASIHTLPPLQSKGYTSQFEHLDPVAEDDPDSYDLVEPASQAERDVPEYSLEQRSEDLFSKEHLHYIFAEPRHLLTFTSYLSTHRKDSVPILIYYLDAMKALRAIKYANAVAGLLEPIKEHDFTQDTAANVQNQALQVKADAAFDILTNQDLPAFITWSWVKIVSLSIQQRITGRLPPHLREQSEGLAEVFCLSDPSRRDNPIVFASEEFHRTTQYGVDYAIGRNCRFLQGPRTNGYSVERLRKAVSEGRDHTEVFLNYRRDGSPFLNLLMVAPLRDSRGSMRYFIGAQVDVSNLAKDCQGFDGLKKMLADAAMSAEEEDASSKQDDFAQLAEMFNHAELGVVRERGGRMHTQAPTSDERQSWDQSRLILKDDNLTPPEEKNFEPQPARNIHGRLHGVYTHYLLVRPYPSLRILFTSPSLRIPGILQSPFMDRIRTSERNREELLAALSAGRGFTARVRWLTSSHDDQGRGRWIHGTPLLGANGSVGVWMLVLVDDPGAPPPTSRFREAPPVPETLPRRRDLSARKGPTTANVATGVKHTSLNADRPLTAASSEEPYREMGKPSIVSGRR